MDIKDAGLAGGLSVSAELAGAKQGESEIMRRETIRHVSRLLLLFSGGLVFPSVQAAGFYLSEVGSPGRLGTAGVANPTNTLGPDSAWTNPAGMTGLNKDRLLFGFQAVIPKVEFDSSTATAGGSDGGNAGNTAVIPSFFYVNKLNDRTRLGLSVVAPMGGGVNYGDDFVGRYQTIRAELATVALSPAIGYKLTDRFSVGAGVSFIYTKYEQKIAINQAAVVGPGTPDGAVRFDNATDWGYQPYAGITWQFTDRALLGVVYRAKMDVKLDGDVNFRNLVIAKPGANDVKLNWDNPRTLEAGLKYQLSDKNHLFLNTGWQDWSEFSNNELTFSGGTVGTLDRQWDDTWHAGIAFAHLEGEDNGYSVGFSYESSPVDNKHRTFDLPVDEAYKLSAAYFWEGAKELVYSLGGTMYFIGDANIDLTAQGVRAAGKYDRNNILFLGGTVRYEF
jgi:long-chain fatty acid transport protein